MAKEFLSKSWLFEVVNTKTNTIVDSFTLILPPQSYTIREKQRVKVTKTFGNAIVDDYGPDNVEITLKAISGTAHVFPTFSSRGSTTPYLNFFRPDSFIGVANTGYSQKDAFYVFRNNIMRYKNKYPDNYEDFELRVYDLSDRQGYKCVLLEFSLDRTSDQPLRYPFTISLFVYQRLNGRPDVSEKIFTIAEDPTIALDRLDAFLDRIESVYARYSGISNAVVKVKQSSARMRARLNLFYTRTGNILVSPLTVAKDLLDASMNVHRATKEAFDTAKLSAEQWCRCTELVQSALREAMGIYGFSVTNVTVVEASIDEDSGLSLTPPSSVELEPSTRTPDSPGTWPSSTKASMSIAGVKEYVVSGEDTLQRIALKEMGDPSLWSYIAVVNDITGNDEISAGDRIFIPVIESFIGTSAKDAFIMTEDAHRDPYGTDIRLNADGEIIVGEGNDLRLISGIENVIQSVNLRLSTPLGSMIRQTAFGLAAQTGVAMGDISTSYLRMSLEASLLSDPRILSVPGMSFGISGDAIQAKLSLQLVGYSDVLPVTVAL